MIVSVSVPRLVRSVMREPSPSAVAAMAATALGLGSRITERTNLGTLTETIIRGSRGHLVVYSAGNDAVFVMSGPLSANLTLMRIEARAAAVQINSLFGRY